MNDKEFLENINTIIRMLLKYAANSFGIDIIILEDTLEEVQKRLNKFDN